MDFLPLLSEHDWPAAINFHELASTEEEKLIRGAYIVNKHRIRPNARTRFLDYGCGEGYVAKYLSKNKLAVNIGYDPQVKATQTDRYLLTADLAQVKAQAPYDVIMAYDVLDHSPNPRRTLQEIASLANRKTQIYVTTHPWCSRHAGHDYQQHNKAFSHLFLPLPPEQVSWPKVYYPLNNYAELFADLFNVQKVSKERQRLEKFFTDTQHIVGHLEELYSDKLVNIRRKLEICFLHYQLQLK